jgi:4'-phosphopantetheinyl transferase EntD
MSAARADHHQRGLAGAACLTELLPPGTVLVAAGVAAEGLGLPAAEAARAARLPRGRAGEFTAGRWCAHRALQRLGCPEAAIGTGPHGEPCWPEGFTGSITHKAGAAVAVAALAPAAIGIDLEQTAALPLLIRHRVLLPAEPDLPQRFPVSAPAAERIVFSAKEAYYKWHHSAHGGPRRPGFADVRIRLHAGDRPLDRGQPARGMLHATPIATPTPAPALAVPPAVGAWICGPRWILAAVWAASAPAPS